eukprot:scaffold91410_cov17-Tisochrysis_lutea.AAC.1
MAGGPSSAGRRRRVTMSMALRVALMMCKAGRASADLPIMAAIDFRGADGQILANSHPFSFK